MDDFYKEICATTKMANENLPARATVEIYVMEALETIIKDWKIMAKIAALSGFKKAYLGVFQKSFKIRGRVRLYDYFEMNEEARDLFDLYDINLLEDQIIKIISPFRLEMKESDEIFALLITWE